MVAVAASPTPGLTGGPHFAVRSHDHPPYKDMIVSAIETLKDRNGSSRQAISKYISDNYSDLPPTHATLLARNLRRLHSKGLIFMVKHSYKIANNPAPGNGGTDSGTKRRGRPPKSTPLAPAVLDETHKRRGRPPKLGADSLLETRRSTSRPPKPKAPVVVDHAAVYILPQAEQLQSGFMRSLPGAVAIVLPKDLLRNNTASPVLILPNGVQSLVDASSWKKKMGRPKKIEVENKPDQPEQVLRRESRPSRRKAVLPKQLLVHNGDGNHVNIVSRKSGRPRKIKDSGVSVNDQVTLDNSVKLDNTEAEHGITEKARNQAMPKSHEGMQTTAVFEFKQRSVGRHKKGPIVESLKSRTYAS